MKRTFATLACLGALALAACTADSQLPNPTGKGSVRAINAIPGSPPVDFRIEERSLGNVAYKKSSAPARYDDFEYNFNFDIQIPGDADPTRIATVALQVEADRDYVFVLSGDIANPVVTTWTTDLREWASSDTLFEARFAHLAESLGPIDVYFYDSSGAAPVQGEQVATLSYGDVMDPTDFENGTYVAMITAAGDITTVYHQSVEFAMTSQASRLFSLFDADANETSPYTLMSMSAAGQELRLPDPSYPPTIRFVHGARTLPAVDIYSDETLTNLVAANVALGDATARFDTEPAATTWYFTPTGSTATVLFEQATVAPPYSTPTELYLTGDTDLWVGINLSHDRASASTLAKLTLFHSAFNTASVDMYIVNRGETVADDAIPSIGFINYGLPSTTASLLSGSYDIYLAEYATKNIVAGPYEIDIDTGDVVFLLGIDNVNPGLIDIVDVSLP